MSDYVIKKFSEEERSEEVVPVDVQVTTDVEGSDDDIDKDDREVSDGTYELLRSALKAASDGIKKGISLDFASTEDGLSIFHDIKEVITSPIKLTTPSRKLERSIRDTSGIVKSNESINQDAKNIFQRDILKPAQNLYGSNFATLLKVLESISFLKLTPLNNITKIESFAIKFKAKDDTLSPFSSESPYKDILKRIIPILREKFDAVASFRKTLGPGEDIGYNEISLSNDGDIAELERFYKAIKEWSEVLAAFEISPSLTGLTREDDDQSASGDSSFEAPETTVEVGVDPPSEPEIAKDIQIHAIRPGQYVEINPTGDGSLMVKEQLTSDMETPVVKLYMRGDGADEINTSGSGEQYLAALIERGHVRFPSSATLSALIYNVTRESVSGGAELSIYFNPEQINALKNFSSSGLELMRVKTTGGARSVFADDSLETSLLKKISSSETTSYYEAISPSGESVYFTPSDLVISGGKLRDSKGKKFKPKKIKGKSLADRVMSKGFGKGGRSK